MKSHLVGQSNIWGFGDRVIRALEGFRGLDTVPFVTPTFITPSLTIAIAESTFEVHMAKKKRSVKNDSRGYSTSVAAAPKKNNINLTNKKQQEHIQSLLSQRNESAALSAAPTWIDTTTKEFYKRMNSLHSSLIKIGFKEQQIERIVPGLVCIEATSSSTHLLALENALDWACLHLTADDLPPILREANLRDTDKDADQTLEVLQVAKPIHHDYEPIQRLFESTAPLLNMTHMDEPENDTIDDGKAWILSQYQYESDDGEAEVDSDLSQEMEYPNPQQEFSRSPEQIRLESLENEIKELMTDLSDEAANYQRSKYEIKDMKKALQKLKVERSKLNMKVDKLLTTATQITKNTVKANDKNDIIHTFIDSRDEDAMFGMFDNEYLGNLQTTTPTQQPIVPEIQESTFDPFRLSSQGRSIAKDWTGKTPKILLEEHCKKHKLPRPTFTKLFGTRDGCRVSIKRNKGNPLMLEHAGPFFDFKDAQEYASTHALYILAPDLPLYRLMPLAFSDLWQSWLKLVEDARQAQKDELAQDKDDRVQQLIELITNQMSLSGSKQSDKTMYKENELQLASLLSTLNGVHDSNGKICVSVLSPFEPTNLGHKLQSDFTERQTTPVYREMKHLRVTLPMHAYREQLLQTINENIVTVLHAETGAGKTTQCPQFLLEEALLSGRGDAISIICTQPRRISALSVAERVAEEMCDPLGELVGFQIRMESKRSSKTRLLFCTTGVILRRLQDDPHLTGVTHIVVDEVHERQWQIDFLLIVLRQIIQTSRQDLKVILMSATLDAKLFCSFFGDAPLVSVPGRTFPVANYFLEDLFDATGHIIEEDSRNARREVRTSHGTQEIHVTTRGGEKRQEVVELASQTDITEVSGHYIGYSVATQRSMDRVDEFVINYDLIEDVLTLILDKGSANPILLPPICDGSEKAANGAVLIFLPGMGEIRALTDRLKGSRFFGDSNRFDVIPMHSSLSPQDQKRAFLKPRAGCRKIILATNIAETSVTIPDCVCVIDSGLGREVRQDKRSSTSTLVLDWCSKASAKQRAGRAGRVQAGVCCKLYSSRTHQLTMRAQAFPELQRVPLEEICLSILAGKFARCCKDFLQQAPQPPNDDAVQVALDLLREVGAIDEIETLTPLGHHLSKIPVHVRLGKMLIFGSLFGCLDRILTIVASLCCKSLFSTTINNTTEAQALHKSFRHECSDFLTSCNVWEAFCAARESARDRGRDFCRRNYLNWTALIEIEDMRKQNFELMSQIGFVQATKNSVTDKWFFSSKYNRNHKNERVLQAVLCAGLYPHVAHVMKAPRDDFPLLWHKSEQLYIHSSSVNHRRKVLEEEWIVFHDKFSSGRTTVSATSPIHSFALLLFGGTVQVCHLDRKVFVDDWIELKVAAQTGVMFRELRRKLNLVLTERIESPDSQQDQEIVDGIVQLLLTV